MRTSPRDIDVDRGPMRSLRVRIAGADVGPLVLYMHGSPSSRLDVDYLDARSARRGVRLVGVDRPGYGGSAYEKFDYASVAADAAAVADHLHAPRFAVFGQSSGAGYALATAASHPDRVTAVATGGGGGPFEPGTRRWEHLSEGEKRGVALIGIDDTEAERLLAEADKWIVDQLTLDDEEIATAWLDAASPADKRVLTAGLGRLLAPTIRESLRQGQAGWARDNVVRMARWDFDLAAIRCRATFWMGEEDGGNVEAAPWLVAGAQHAELRVLADQGHFVAFERWDDVLSSLGV